MELCLYFLDKKVEMSNILGLVGFSPEQQNLCAMLAQ
jgi:hypothetical protein